MKFFALSLMLGLLSACAAHAEINTDTVDPSGFVAERLERIDNAINAEVAAGKIPGAVALVIKDGRTVYHKSFGYADIERQVPMRNDAIFRIASMTKAVTTVAVMQLYEKGLFRLNDPVSKYLPGFANPVVQVGTGDDAVIASTRPAAAEIRIIDLLTHSSGISYAFMESPVQDAYQRNAVIDGVTEKPLKLGTVMARLAKQPLLFDPGTSWAYGLNTDLLGYLVEEISGMPLDQYFAKEIFAPLHMDDTYFYLPGSKADRLVTLYADVDGLVVARGDESSLFLDNPRYPVEGARTYFSGGAGLSSTASDYARLIEMLLNDGALDGARVLGRKSVELIRTPRVDMDGDGTADFGLGFEVISDLGANGELGSTGIYSWGGAFATSFWIDPEEQLVAVIMTQVRPTTSDIRYRFRTLVYQALE